MWPLQEQETTVGHGQWDAPQQSFGDTTIARPFGSNKAARQRQGEGEIAAGPVSQEKWNRNAGRRVESDSQTRGETMGGHGACLRRNKGFKTMTLGTILLILLVVALLGGFSGRIGGYGYGYGHGGVGVIGVIAIVVLILVLTGRL
jgi:hypothetical protein